MLFDHSIVFLRPVDRSQNVGVCFVAWKHEIRLAGIELEPVKSVSRFSLVQMRNKPVEAFRIGKIDHTAKAIPPSLLQNSV